MFGGMDLRILQAFIRVAELGSFGRAAAVLNQTQPTISRQIAALERELGGALFTRHRYGVTLSAAGAVFRDRALQALRGLDQARAELTAQAEEPSGTVSLGLPPSLLSVLSGPVVDRFAKGHPRVLLHVYEAISQGLEELMRSGEADVAVLIADRKVLRNVALTPLATEPVVLAGYAGAPYAPDKPIGVEALAGLPLLMFRPPNYLRLLAETALRKRGLPFNVAIELETLPLAIDLVERGAGYAVLPPSGLAGMQRRIVTAPIRGMAVSWTLAVNRDRAARPAVRALAASIRAQADTLIKNRVWKRAGRQGAS
jgi:LysR family nitrogen assimilation transcriptional regulator